jgi:hypothetical protein
VQEAVKWAEEYYQYRGISRALSAVVRCDLNKYSEWCREREPEDRVPLLNEFFTHTLITAQRYGGVYYRDEGDCVVLLFSDYFGTQGSLSNVRAFTRAVSRESYGEDGLTAKSIVSAGDLVYYQKHHEQGTDEWSADGDPFIFAARVEAEAESKRIVHYRKEEYDEHFAKSRSDDDVDWETKEESVRIPGLWQPGGHQKIVKDIYTPASGNSGDSSKDFRAILTDSQEPDPVDKRGGGRYASK